MREGKEGSRVRGWEMMFSVVCVHLDSSLYML